MQQLATTLITTRRGTTSSDYGDVTDAFETYLVSIPAALVEQSRIVFDPATQMPRTVRTFMCVVPSWADILDTDTIQDQTTGGLFEIQTLERQPSLGVPPDLILTLRERSAAGITSD